MRGQKEQECLELVKNYIFTVDGKPLIHPFTNQTYLDVSDEEFQREQIWFINSECHINYFGLLEEDRIEIEQILRAAKPNINASAFPDFVFENGFIEHFQVTSSKETKKGAKHTKEMSLFASKVNAETERLKQEWDDTPSFDKVRSKQWMLDNPEHSHEYLVQSFERNWSNHIESLEQYAGNKGVGIFLVEYSDFALSMIENVYKDWINGMAQGDMREQEKFHCYRLTRDKRLLDFIYQYKEQIKYVIFVYCSGFEIIRLENIPYLLNLLPWEYIIYPMTVKNISSVYNISVPADLKEKDGMKKG